jgi:hypothetical protein
MLILFILAYLAVGFLIVIATYLADVSGIGPGNSYIRLLNSWTVGNTFGNTFLTVALTAAATVLWPIHLAIFFAAK